LAQALPFRLRYVVPQNIQSRLIIEPRILLQKIGFVYQRTEKNVEDFLQSIRTLSLSIDSIVYKFLPAKGAFLFSNRAAQAYPYKDSPAEPDRQ
jgi:hypothetical protein